MLTFWFTGLSGSGKTTLARALRDKIHSLGKYKVVLLDGDELRKIVCCDLGFTKRDRDENIKRASGIARILNDQGCVVISAFITPTNRTRRAISVIVGEERVRLIHVKCSLEECVRRDDKGLYKCNVPMLTGVSQYFDAPTLCDLVVDTEKYEVEESANYLFQYVKEQLSGVRKYGDT